MTQIYTPRPPKLVAHQITSDDVLEHVIGPEYNLYVGGVPYLVYLPHEDAAKVGNYLIIAGSTNTLEDKSVFEEWYMQYPQEWL